MGPVACGGILKQWHQARSVVCGALGQLAKIQHRWEQAEQVYGCVAYLSGLSSTRQSRCRALGHTYNQRNSRNGPPWREFLPMFFLAKLPAVIRPQDHDRIFGIRSRLQRIEHSPQHCVCKVNGSQVALNSLLPLPLLLNMCEILVSRRPLPRFGDIVEIVFLIARRKLNRFQWKRFEILLGNEPRLMRSIKTTAKKKWFVVLPTKLITDPLTDRPIAPELLIRDIQCRPVCLDILPRPTPLEADGPFFRIECVRKRIL